MVWQYSHRGRSQLKSVGAAMAALGIVMLVFGAWHWHWNRELTELGTLNVSAARYRTMALPAVFGLAVLIGGTSAMLIARRRQRAR